MTKYVIYIHKKDKILEHSHWIEASDFDNQDDAIEACGEYLYDGLIVRIEEELNND